MTDAVDAAYDLRRRLESIAHERRAREIAADANGGADA